MISVIGLGMVGKAIFDSFKSKNIKVNGYDKYKNIGNLKECLESEIIFLCLPTLYSYENNEYDKKEIITTVNYLVENNYQGLLILKSTVEPGTTKELSSKYHNIIHNPEFLSAKTSLDDFNNQTHIVIGKTSNCDIDKIITLYNTHYTDNISIVTSDESELMKISINCFYATKIQFFNEIYSLCNKKNISYNNVRSLMLKNNWINPMHTEVPGSDGYLSYGGACFPKDTNALLSFMKENNSYHNVLEATIKERNTMRNEIRLADFFVDKKDILQKEKFINLCKKYNISFFDHQHYNRNRLIKGENIFLHLGDETFESNKLRKINKNYKNIFSVNCNIKNNKIISIPLGLTDTSWCSIIGDIDIFEEFNKKEKKYINLAYINFNTERQDKGTNDRLKIKELFSSKDWTTDDIFQRDKEGHRNFINNIYNHKFIFCPRGNGIDTHRLWMSLYLRSIPIVKYDNIHENFKHLPILFIKEWEEINENYLNLKYQEINSKYFNMEILKLSYWENIFANLK